MVMAHGILAHLNLTRNLDFVSELVDLHPPYKNFKVRGNCTDLKR